MSDNRYYVKYVTNLRQLYPNDLRAMRTSFRQQSDDARI